MLDDIYNDANSRMDQAIQHTQMEINKIRTGRANPELFNTIMIDYYGTSTPLNQVSTVSVPEPRLITLQPYEKTHLYCFHIDGYIFQSKKPFWIEKFEVPVILYSTF